MQFLFYHSFYRFENGTLIPNAEEIAQLCKALDIYESELFNTTSLNRSINNDSYTNPFNTDKLYLYFNAYNYKTKKFAPDVFILEFEQKQDICRVKFVDSHDKRIYTEGYLKYNNEIAFIVLENYKPTSSRIDVGVIEININNGIDGLMLGAYFGTNAECIPCIRKCYCSKKKVAFSKAMLEKLKLNEHERYTLNQQNALYLDIFNN